MSRWPIDPAELLVGGLDAEQRVVAERLVREDPAFRAEVERLRCLTAALSAARTAEVGPPPALDLDAARAARPASAGRRARPWARPVVLRPAAALASAVLLLVAGAGGGALLWGGGGDDRGDLPDDARVVALSSFGGAPADRASVRVGPSAAGLVATGLQASRPGEHYELWLLNSPDDLVSVGTFRVGADGRVDVRFDLGVDPARFAYLDVSVERDDGDPGHSARSVLRSDALTSS